MKIRPYSKIYGNKESGIYKVAIRPSKLKNQGLMHVARIDPTTKEMSITETVWVNGDHAESMGTKSTASPSEGVAFFEEVMKWLYRLDIETIDGWAPKNVAAHYCRKYKGCRQLETRVDPVLGIDLVRVQFRLRNEDMSKKQTRASIGMALVFGLGVVGQNLGLGDLAVGGWFLANGLVGLGALIAYGFGTASNNMAEAIKAK